MLTWLHKRRERREERARKIVYDFLDLLVEKAAYKQKKHASIQPWRPWASYLARTLDKLDTTMLKRLLKTNDDGVMEWANCLPRTKQVLGDHGLMFVYESANQQRKNHRHLIVADDRSTPNCIILPGWW